MGNVLIIGGGAAGMAAAIAAAGCGHEVHLYEKNEKYEESREILYLAYDRSPVGRMIVYKLVELSIQLGDLKEAVNYFKEYTQLAPNDSNIYILKYKLYKAKKSNLEVLISILEDLKNNDPHEEWSLDSSTHITRQVSHT